MKLLIAIKSEALANRLSSSLPQYDVHVCHTGTETLVLLDTLHPEAVILDLSLPVMDGLSVLRQARYKPPIILALTNLRTDEVLQDALAAGVQNMILKPCTIRHIVKHLDALTEKAPSPEA